MELMVTADTTTLSYWLNWRVLLCALWVLSSMTTASYVVWRCEGSTHPKHSRKQTPPDLPDLYVDDDAWRTCVKEIHPLWLLAYRVISFCVFLSILSFDIAMHGTAILFFYTQWTFALVTIYFGLGSVLSLYGCYQRHKIGQRLVVSDMEIDPERSSYFPLSYPVASGLNITGNNSISEVHNCLLEAGIWGHVFQVLFQLIAGAVVLTDCVYWSIIFPFLTLYDYDLHAMTYLMHSLNAIFVLGDTALNCLPFPWFRISYFVLWTGVFVIAQWIIHIFASVRWPYPFLDLSSPYAPLWYLLVGLMQVPCYGIFVFIVDMKVAILSRWCPQSCQCSR